MRADFLGRVGSLMWVWSAIHTTLAAAANQLNVPASAFTSYFLPTLESGPCDVSTGPDNLLYVQEFFTDKIAQFNQHTGQWKEFDVPFTVPFLNNFTIPIPSYAKAELLACGIRTGYDGHMFFSNGAHNQLVRFNVTTGEVDVFTPPGGLGQVLGNLEPFNDLTTAPDGVYFSQTTGNVITKFDYTTHRFTSFQVPTPLAIPVGMFYASDGGVWVLEFGANKVARFDRTTHVFEEYDLPLGASQPLVVRAETPNSDGSTTLWFACTISSSIAGINTRSRKIVNYLEPNGPTETAETGQDQAGNVWATHIVKNSLGVLNPRSGVVSEVVEPEVILDAPAITVPFYGESGIIGYTVGQPPGHGDPAAAGNAIWYTHFLTNQLIRLDLDGIEIP